MKLASIERIKSVKKHPNADTLSIVSCAGYEAIVKTGSFNEGELVVFIQPDTCLPDAPWAAFYKSKSKRVKACKIRGIWSLGIVEKPSSVGIDIELQSAEKLGKFEDIYKEGTDISEQIGVTKYEPPTPQDLSAKGNLPFGIFKTDESRYQSIDVPYGEVVDVSLKLDGQSGSYAYKNGEFAICSRSLEIKPDCENNYTRIAAKYDIQNKLTAFCEKNKVNLCLRGEITGNNIQNFKVNPMAGTPLDFYVFSVLNLDTLKYEGKDSPFYFTKVAAELNLKSVPIIEENVVLTPELIKRYDEELEKIDGKPFEGIVIKRLNGESFKIISKYYDSVK